MGLRTQRIGLWSQHPVTSLVGNHPTPQNHLSVTTAISVEAEPRCPRFSVSHLFLMPPHPCHCPSPQDPLVHGTHSVPTSFWHSGISPYSRCFCLFPIQSHSSPLFPFETSAKAANSRTKRMDQASSLRQWRAFLEGGPELLGCQHRLGCLSLTFYDRPWNQSPALSYSIPENPHQPHPLLAMSSQALSSGHWLRSRFLPLPGGVLPVDNCSSGLL